MDIAYTHGKSGAEKSDIFENEFVTAPVASRKSLKKNLWRLVHQHPSPMLIFDNHTKSSFRSLTHTNDYDFILFRYLNSTQLAFSLPEKYRMKTIIDIDDIPSSNIYEMQFGEFYGIKRFFAWLNHIILKRYENKCMSLGATLFCSGTDLATMKNKRDEKNLFVVPNIYNNPTFETCDFGDGYQMGHVLLFVGALSYRPNIEGLEWFIATIFPAFITQFPNAKLMVVGRDPDIKVRQLCNKQFGVELHTNVPDIRPFYQKARAVVVPLLAGGGTRIKILEAALSNRPVLSTPIGASGLAFEHNTDILLFQTPKELLEGYKKLESHESYTRIVEKARSVVLNKYSSNSFRKGMEAVLQHIDGN